MSALEVRDGPNGIFYLAGEFDLTGEDLFKAKVGPSLQRHRETVLDLTELTFMDATGVRCIKWAVSQVRGCEVVVLNAPFNVIRLFALTGLNDDPAVRVSR